MGVEKLLSSMEELAYLLWKKASKLFRNFETHHAHLLWHVMPPFSIQLVWLLEGHSKWWKEI